MNQGIVIDTLTLFVPGRNNNGMWQFAFRPVVFQHIKPAVGF